MSIEEKEQKLQDDSEYKENIKKQSQKAN